VLIHPKTIREPRFHDIEDARVLQPSLVDDLERDDVVVAGRLERGAVSLT
jgi:hypothetical protein